MSSGDVIHYNDVRRFGSMTLIPAKGDGEASALQGSRR